MRITNIGRYAAATLLVAGLGASPAAAASARPDLSVSTLSGSVGSLAPGASVTATLKVRNAGPGRARASTLALYLARGAKHARADVRLATAKVPALKRRGTARRALRTTLPAFTPAATYRLLACADSAGKVRERSERNNCRAAKDAVVVRDAPVAPTPAPTQAPLPGTAPRDADADGFPADADCNDADAAIHPGAADPPELTFTDSNCDGIDGDAAHAVFVSPAGDDASPGTREAPKQTFLAAVAAAQSRGGDDVYAQLGIYRETLQVRDAVSVYGGYDSSWRRSVANRTRLQSDAGISTGARADAVSAPTTLQLLSLEPSAPAAPSTTSYGLRADHAPGLVLDHVDAHAAPGRPGSDGADGERGADGRTGADGHKGSCSGARGQGGDSLFTDGRSGGRGGDGAHGISTTLGYGPAGDGGQAGSFGAGGAGGPGGATRDPGKTGGAGASGGAGRFNGDGRPPDTSGFVFAGTWRTDDARDGFTGGNGSGGGGGGGGGGQACNACSPGGGNGGGEGGQGGQGGGGGQAGETGGASFGAFVTESPGLVIIDSALTAADGGNGGVGGLGAFGGAGGARGLGATECLTEVGAGGNGGVGGGGARGGNGGGGAGGPSYGLFSDSPAVTIERTTLAHGAGGAPGTGAGGVAPAGVAADHN